MAFDFWSLQPLGNLFPKIVVGYVGNVNKYYCDEDTGVPFYRTLNIRDGHFRHDEIRYVTREFNDKNRKSQIENGDIVIARVGANLGMTCQVTGLQGSANMANAIIIKAKHAIDADPDFFAYYLVSPMGKSQIFSGAAGGAQGVFNTKLTQEILVPNPPLPEQKKIAQILSTWDQAITATERLLENSQQRKKGLMQQLLTGKKRLPGFEGEWVSSQLNEIFTFKRGKGLSKGAILKDGQHKCVLYGELYTRYGEVIRDVVSRCDDDDGLSSKAGDVLLPSSTTTSGIDLANATAVIEDGIRLGGDIIVLRAKSTQDPIFFAHLLTHIKKHEIASKAQGITIIHLYSRDLADLMVRFPANTEEQKAISKIMTIADAEVAANQGRLEFLKQEKKALMQQLLTGKRRVQVDTEAA